MHLVYGVQYCHHQAHQAVVAIQIVDLKLNGLQILTSGRGNNNNMSYNIGDKVWTIRTDGNTKYYFACGKVTGRIEGEYFNVKPYNVRWHKYQSDTHHEEELFSSKQELLDYMNKNTDEVNEGE